MTKQRISAFVLGLLLAVFLTACDGGENEENGGEGDGEDEEGYYTLVLLG